MSRTAATWTLACLALLGGCASGPGAGRFGSDGPEPNPPPDLIKVPDAEPKLEPIRIGGPNKPYDVLGHSYVPLTQDTPFTERGLASWYGRKFNGKRTSSGELYNMYGMTAAHPTLPIPSYARVRNPANGKEVVVRINDRGPFHSSRIVDLSYTAALKLDLLRGVAPVELQRITFEDIRTGAWRRSSDTLLASAGAATPVTDATVATTPSSAAAAVNAPAAQGTATGQDASMVAMTAAPAPAQAPAPAPAPAQAQAQAQASASASASAQVPTQTQSQVPMPNLDLPAPSNSQSVVASNAAPVLVTASADRAPLTPVATTNAAPVAAAAPPVAAPVADAPPARAYTSPARGYWVQLGAFHAHDGAETFLRRVSAEMEWISPLLAIFGDSSVYRLQAGPYASREQARDVAERVRSGLQLVPVIVERR